MLLNFQNADGGLLPPAGANLLKIKMMLTNHPPIFLSSKFIKPDNLVKRKKWWFIFFQNFEKWSMKEKEIRLEILLKLSLRLETEIKLN